MITRFIVSFLSLCPVQNRLSVQSPDTIVVDAEVGFVGVVKTIVSSYIMSVADPSILLKIGACVNISKTLVPSAAQISVNTSVKCSYLLFCPITGAIASDHSTVHRIH